METEQRTDIDFVVQKCKELIRGQYLTRVKKPSPASDEKDKEEDDIKEEEKFTIPHGNGYYFFMTQVLLGRNFGFRIREIVLKANFQHAFKVCVKKVF